MIKLAVCDDIDYMRAEIKKKLLNISFQKNVDFAVDEYESGEQMLEANEQYDLIFMDYELGQGKKNGLEISKEIRKKNKTVNIIFLTSYSTMVFDAFEVGTFRFLVKPIEDEKLEKAMTDFLRLSEEDAYIRLKIDGESHMININEIVYIEGNGKNCTLHLDRENEEILEYKSTLSSVEEMLGDNSKMYRCHKSFIINFDYISKYNRTDIILSTGESVMISRRKYNQFCELYTRKLFE